MQTVLGWLWLAVLALVLFASVRSANELALRTREYAYGCDSFGYMSMAREIRRAVSTRTAPDFRLESRQTRLLIEAMKSNGVREAQWHELVAPHAHHYFQSTDRVAPQYPPGTAIALAIFPEGESVHRLSRWVVWAFAAIGAAALLVAGLAQAWASAGLVVLAVCLGLDILVRLNHGSFSMAAILVPILLACVFAVAAAAARAWSARASWIAGFLAGSFLGFAVLARIPVLLIVPGFVLLLRPRSLRDLARGPAGALMLAIVLFGAIPLALHQREVAGAWHHSTYSRADASWPTLSVLRQNLDYFLGGGAGSGENWAFLAAVAGLAGAVMLSRGRSGRTRDGLDWKLVTLAPLLIWVASTTFFLTHQVTVPYYTAPGTFGAVALLAMGALAVEASSKHALSAAPGERPQARTRTPRATVLLAASALALVPGLVAAARVSRWAQLAPKQEATPVIALPSELADERAWIYADGLTGTLWYYAHKPAFKISFSSPEVRARVYRFAFERGEPQYLIRDTESLEREWKEIELLGGRLERRGDLAGSPYYYIRWPENGPGSAQHLAATN